jgi:hypothetical protein
MRKFSLFRHAYSQQGELCTRERYLELAESAELLQLCKEIAICEDDEKRAELKKQLPVITWQAYFEGKRKAKEAIPSGLFMFDIDHVDNPYQLFSTKVISRIKELGIVYVGKTASTHGMRIVARCKPELHSIEECQKWLASNLKVEYDAVCKDWARCSFLVHDSYTYYMDANAIWREDPTEAEIYDVNNSFQENVEFNEALENGNFDFHDGESEDDPAGETSGHTDEGEDTDQREGLFGGSDEYNGLKYKDIIMEWFEATGGEPKKGDRNVRLYALATKLRYITDFNAATMLRVMPTYGLGEAEMKSIIKNAISASRAQHIPLELQDVLASLKKRKDLGEDYGIEPIIEDTEDLSKIPSLPPVIRQITGIAPDDFKSAVVLTQLPILGTLGSKLRAKYLDGQMHSPSFQVSLEAPQASGKSFMRKIAELELAQIIEHDELQRAEEQEYDKKVRELKLLNIKVNAENKDEVLGSRPESMIRYCSPKMSMTKLLMRLAAAKGLHIFAMAEEIDTVNKAFKTGFSNYSDLLRVAFDNGPYGQDYASENSFSGIVNVYYNVLFSGTPKAMRRFYPDVEDGLVSRVCFVTLPDQFGKPMPIWKELSEKDKSVVDINLVRLNDISIIGKEVQPDHVMKMDFLNKEMEVWIREQQMIAVKDNDRTRDIFCRRAAVVGFRAGMLAFFLWGEHNTPPIRKNVVKFAKWVSNCMLRQHLLRFNIDQTNSNTIPHEKVYLTLGDEFSRDDLQRALTAANIDTPVKNVLYKWRMAGIIEPLGRGVGVNGRRIDSKFSKVKKDK